MKFTLTHNQRRLVWALLLCPPLIRLLSLGSYPLADTTEARYGEVARLMAQSDDWITPQIHQGVPFWGKPPLSTWLSAGSIRLFGVSEFAVRLPSLFIALAVLGLVFCLAAKRRGRDFALLATAGLGSSALFFIGSGVVHTDTALLLGTTLCMVAFWRSIAQAPRGNRLWGHLFFIGLAIGLLAKGPVAVVLTGIPITLWTLWQKQWLTVWRRMPWFTGICLCLALSVPWYWMAEAKTPGFLRYFLIGEHWQRFVVPGWQGDLYGHAHAHPWGTIWRYWVSAAAPWSLVLCVALFSKPLRHGAVRLLKHEDGWGAYLALWAVAPMLLFTPAGNILWTYVLPGLPALALLLTELLLPEQVLVRDTSIFSSSRGARNILQVATVTSLLFALAWVLLAGGIVPEKKSQKDLVAAYLRDQTEQAGHLVYLFKRPQSAEFYSRGEAQCANETDQAAAYLHNAQRDYFAVRTRDLERLPAEIRSHVVSLGEFRGYNLLKEKPTCDTLAMASNRKHADPLDNRGNPRCN